MKKYKLTPQRKVCQSILKPPYATNGVIPPLYNNEVRIFSVDEQNIMKDAARLARRMLDCALEHAQPGVTTDEIDEIVHNAIIDAGAYPSPLNYARFPKSICSSINEVICHGIPDKRPLEFGDVVSFDVSCFTKHGVHGDNCATVIVGDRQEKDVVGVDWRGVPYLSNFDSQHEEEDFVSARRLVQATRESLYEAIKSIGPGKCLSDIGSAIQDVADKNGFGTVEKYRGHGIGSDFHTPPFVKHFRNSDNMKLLPGMIFTIEPMLVEKSGDCFEWSDDWTVATVDGGRAAQFEHTVLITQNGVDILTVNDDIRTRKRCG